MNKTYLLSWHTNSWTPEEMQEGSRKAGCYLFSEDNGGLETTPEILRIHTVNYHGPSQVKGFNFISGLHEDYAYMRAPLYGSKMPTTGQGILKVLECSFSGKYYGHDHVWTTQEEAKTLRATLYLEIVRYSLKVADKSSWLRLPLEQTRLHC